MLRLPIVSLAVLLALPGAALADGDSAGFRYSYFEATVDRSRTDNTARGNIDDADGTLLGVAGSWQFHDDWYVKASWSTEDKSFRNAVLPFKNGVPGMMKTLSLDTTQTVAAVGGGRRWGLDESGDLFVEALAMTTRVAHDVPATELQPVIVINPRTGQPIPGAMAPLPTGDIRKAVIKDNGFALGVGVRYRLAPSVELEPRLGYIDIAEERERKISLAVRTDVGESAAVAAHFSFSKHSDRNFDNIAKLGLSLRLYF